MTDPPASPQVVAWRAAGSPEGAPTGIAAVCSGCGQHTNTATPLAVIVSAKFTGWDQHLPTGGTEPHWCPTCVWLHTTPMLRTDPLLITTDTAHVPTPADLTRTLSTALPGAVAVLLPRAKRKHIAPLSRWGHVTSDEGPVAWTVRDATRFTILLGLRQRGFTTADLHCDAPPIDPFRRLSADEQSETLAVWPAITDWRRQHTTFQIALTVSGKRA